MGFFVLAVARDEEGRRKVHLLPGRDLVFSEGDHLLVKARPQDMAVLRGLQRMEVDLESPVDPKLLEGGDAGFVEVVVAPRSTLVGQTLRQVNFRSRFGMHVVAIVREGEVIRANLRDQVLRLGDALVLYGLRRYERTLAREPDLILLHAPEIETPQQLHLAPLSVVIAAAALLPVLLGWVPVPIGVLGGAVLMVVTRCLTPEEAYRAVEWPTLVLIAGMLSLGGALAESGAMDLLGSVLIDSAGGFGPYALLAAFALITALSGQIIPGPAVVVLMAPMALGSAAALGYSPYPFVMCVAIASTSLASPLSHAAHSLVMAPAGYRVVDFLRLGIPMTVLILTLSVLFTPIFFPF
jgi:di/tricarboxylate transporter